MQESLMLSAGMMYNLKFIREALSEQRLEPISEATGISQTTLVRIRNGRGTPSYRTLEALSNYFMDSE